LNLHPGPLYRPIPVRAVIPKSLGTSPERINPWIPADGPAATICKVASGYERKEAEIKPTWQMSRALIGQEEKKHFGPIRLNLAEAIGCRLFACIYFGSDHERIFRSGISRRSNDSGISESRCAKFIEKGSAFPGARNSGKPVILRGSNFGRKRTLQNEFSGIGCTTISQDSGQFAKDCLTLGVQVKYPISQGYIHGPCWYRQILGIRMAKFHMLDSAFCSRLSGPRQHGITEIDADNLSCRSGSPGGNQRIEPCAASEVQHLGPDRDICEHGHVRNSGKSIHAYRWKTGKYFRRIAYAFRETTADGKRMLFGRMLRSLGIDPANSIAELLIQVEELFHAYKIIKEPSIG
jgi:hypothetical protein